MYFTTHQKNGLTPKRYLGKFVKLLLAFMSLAWPPPPSRTNILTNKKKCLNLFLFSHVCYYIPVYKNGFTPIKIYLAKFMSPPTTPVP